MSEQDEAIACGGCDEECLHCFKDRHVVVTRAQGASTEPCECGGNRFNVDFEVLSYG